MDFNNLSVTSLLITTVCSLVFYLVFTNGQRFLKGYKQGKILDGIAGNSGTSNRHWLLGDAKNYNVATDEGRKLMIERSETYPKMFNHWFSFIFSVLHLYHPESAGPVLKSKYSVTSKAPLGYGFVSPWIGNGLISSAGEHWARHRKMITPAFHFKQLKGYAKIFNSNARVLVEKWKKCIGSPIEVHNPVSVLTMDSLLKCAMSVEEDLQNMTSSENPTIKYMMAVNDMEDIAAKRLGNIFFHYDWIYQWSALAKKQKGAIKVLDDYANDMIDRRRKEREEQAATDLESKDFLDILFNARDEHGNALQIDEIKDEVATFLFAGYDTTSSAISWAVYNLAMHPDLQEKCRDEVQNLLRDKEDVEWDVINKLEYLTMFVKESMRLFPTVYGIGRLMNENLGAIPKESIAVISIMTQHRNRSVWKNPDHFDPERFSKENRQSIPPLAYIPFSAGPRNCIGQQFAMNEIKITLAILLKNFQIYRDEETPNPVIQPKLIYQSDNGIYVKLKHFSN